MKVDFNVHILNQLLTLKPEKANKANIKFPRLIEWQSDLAKPTINQLSDLADYFNIPFGYFFLKQVPIDEYPITHYRTVNKGKFEPSEELRDTIKTLEQRQKWASQIMKKIDYSPVEFANTLTINDDIKKAAQQIRDLLDLHENWAQYERFGTWMDAFKFLVNKIENAGVFVVINGVVGNNTKRPLNIYEFRGFVLYDEYAPFIFVNGLDYVSGRIFTLIHEFVHILIGKSASFDYSNLQPANNAIEEFCDSVAAEFLVSTDSLLHNFNIIGKDYQRLAYKYKVSKIVIIRRLLDLGKITYKEFLDALEILRSSNTEKTKPEKPGGDFYNNQPNRISKRFFNLLYSAVKQEKILYRDAFRLTGLTPQGYDTYIDKFLTKAS